MNLFRKKVLRGEAAMRDKTGWFCVAMAIVFVFMAFLEYFVFEDIYAVVVCLTGANVYVAASLVLLKLDEILETIR